MCARVDEPELFATLVALRRARDRPRARPVHDARAVRLRAGDYLLAHHDGLRDGNPVEVMLDISAACVPGAEVHESPARPGVVLRVASAPRAAAIVERGPSVGSNHTYVSRLHADAEIVRIIAELR